MNPRSSNPRIPPTVPRTIFSTLVLDLEVVLGWALSVGAFVDEGWAGDDMPTSGVEVGMVDVEVLVDIEVLRLDVEDVESDEMGVGDMGVRSSGAIGREGDDDRSCLRAQASWESLKDSGSRRRIET